MVFALQPSYIPLHTFIHTFTSTVRCSFMGMFDRFAKGSFKTGYLRIILPSGYELRCVAMQIG